MTDKIIWQWLMPTMARLPILRKLAVRIYAKKLTGIVVQSINHYSEAMDMRNNSELKDNPLWGATCVMSALLALMPAAMIYGYLKLNQETGEPK